MRTFCPIHYDIILVTKQKGRQIMQNDFEMEPGGRLYQYWGNDPVVEVPSNVRRITCCAFSCIEELKIVKIPEGVKTIESLAFAGCPKLERVEIPASVTTFHLSVFSGSPKVTIYAPKNSKAEKYAIENHISFSCL